MTGGGSGMVQGLVQAVGVSNYGPKQMTRIYNYLSARGVPLASAQARLIPQLLFVPPHHDAPRVCGLQPARQGQARCKRQAVT